MPFGLFDANGHLFLSSPDNRPEPKAAPSRPRPARPLRGRMRASRRSRLAFSVRRKIPRCLSFLSLPIGSALHVGWSDLPLARSLWGDPAVTRLISRNGFTESEIGDRLAREISSQIEHGIQYWPIFLQSDGVFVGCCGLRQRSARPAIPELGFQIGSAHCARDTRWKRLAAWSGYAFESKGFEALFAGHHPENIASSALLARLGFSHLHDEFYPPTGRMHPSYTLYRVVKKSPKKAQIERGGLIALLVLNYAVRVPGLLRQGWVGYPAIAVGALMVFVAIVLLAGKSAKAALLLGILASIGAFMAVVGYVWMWPRISPGVRISGSGFLISVAFSLLAAYCALDLWLQWGKKKDTKPAEES